MLKSSFEKKNFWIFDLDNTIYDPKSKIFDQIEQVYKQNHDKLHSIIAHKDSPVHRYSAPIQISFLDSIDNVPFHINATWNDTFEKVMMAVVLAYFGGCTTEKATSLFKK